MVDGDLEIDNSQEKKEEIGNYVELGDFAASQETVESFGSKMVKVHGPEADKDQDKYGEGPLRRCDRLTDKRAVRVDDLAKEIVAEKMIMVTFLVMFLLSLLYCICLMWLELILSALLLWWIIIWT